MHKKKRPPMDENGRRIVREMASYKKSQMTLESMSESIRRKMASIQKEQGKNVDPKKARLFRPAGRSSFKSLTLMA